MVCISGVKKKEERAPVGCTLRFHYGKDVTNLTSFTVHCKRGC